MIVMKFGGSSVSDAERIRRVCGIVKLRLPRKPVVVVSAFRGVTDDLLALARSSLAGDFSLLDPLKKKHDAVADMLGVARSVYAPLFQELSDLMKGISLIKELTPRTLDCAASFGERLSTRIIADYFSKDGLPARQFDASDAGLVTDGRFGQASPLPAADAQLRASLGAEVEVPVVTGFLGRTAAGEITTLGRNGSDFSATIIGAALGCSEIEIWSDTDGIMTADPRLVPEAKPLEALSFEEACELAYYGGKVLHPHTLVPAMRKDIPVRVLNTFRPEHPGTRIVAHLPGAPKGVKSIAFKKHQSIVSVSSPRMAEGYGFLARIFEVFARHEISVNMIATSEVTVSVTTDGPAGLESALAELQEEFETSTHPDKAVVCVVGDGISHTPGIAGDVFSAVKDAGAGIFMISQGASKNNIAFVVDNEAVQKTVSALHRRFF